MYRLINIKGSTINENVNYHVSKVKRAGVFFFVELPKGNSKELLCKFGTRCFHRVDRGDGLFCKRTVTIGYYRAVSACAIA